MSAPAHTVAVLLSEPVVPVVLVVKVAVLGWLVQVPAWSPLKCWWSVNVVGLESVDETVPSVPPRVSVTVTLPSTVVVGAPKVKPAVPLAVPFGVEAAAASQVAVAVLVPEPGSLAKLQV